MTFSGFAHELVRPEKKTFDLKSGSELRLILDFGDITISTWDKNQVYIEIKKWVEADNLKKAEKKIEELQVEFVHRNDFLEIRELKRTDKGYFSKILKKTGLKKSSSSRIDFLLKVPKHLDIFIDQNTGKIKIDTLHGNLNIEQKKGSLNLNYLSLDKVDLRLRKTQAKIQNLKGNTIPGANIAISAKEGNLIFQDNMIGKLVFDLDDSDCYLTRNRIVDCDIETKNGDVFLHPLDLNESNYKITSERGDMNLLITASPLCSIKLETGLGLMRSEHPWNIKKRGSGRYYEFKKSNPNRGKLEIITDLGDIYIEK